MDGISNTLIQAVRNGRLEIVRDLVNRYGLSYSQNWAHGYVLLRDSIELNRTEIAKFLINGGAKVNSKTNKKESSSTPLHFAVKNDNKEILEMLLQRAADVNAKDAKGCTPLALATVQGNQDIIEILLQWGANIPKHKDNMTPLDEAGSSNIVESNMNLTSNQFYSGKEFTQLLYDVDNHKDQMTVMDFTLRHEAINNGGHVDEELENGKTILSFAVESGLPLIVETILKHFPDKTNTNNKNALKIAAKCSGKKYVTIVEKLLKYGFSVEPEAINDISLLENCVRMGYIKILEDLLKHGLVLSCNKDESTLLHIAVKSRQTEVAKFLLTNGSDVNATDKSGKPAIFYSTQKSDIIMTEVLLSHGSNLKKCPELLIIATTKPCKEMFEILLQNQADIEATDEFGRTALHLIIFNKYDSDFEVEREIVKLLLNKGANVNAKTDKDDLTALHIACQKSLTDFVKVLLEYKADVNCIAQDLAPLHIAAQNGQAQIVEMLLANGANVNSRRENGETSLHIAAKRNHLRVLNILLMCGALIESEEINGATAIHTAAVAGNSDVVFVLLQHGALIDAKAKNGQTALHFASEVGRSDVVKLLLMLGSDINMLTNDNLSPMDLAKQSLGIPFFRIRTNYLNEIIKMLGLHLIMLKTANLYLNAQNLLYLNTIVPDDTVALNEKEYKEEVERLKNDKLGRNNVSFYDILTKNICSLAKYARNDDIRKIVYNNHYKLEYPNYSRIIERNFIRGLQRNRLLEQAQGFFTRYFEFPYVCSDKILSYLSDDDLKIIINI